MTGFVNVYKEEGVSSAYCVNRLKRLFSVPCGHMGTLDPLAEGVLPVGVGNATRLFNYFLGKDKRYLARFRFGYTTETLDREGTPVPCGRVPSAAEIEAALPALTGEIMQVPPKYSAVSVNGLRGYRLARRGAEFELAAKKVRVGSFRLLGETAPGEYAFEIVCGSGTYIRSLARDLGASLGTGAYMSALKRTASGVFTEETAVRLGAFTPENAQRYLIPVDEVIPFPVFESGDPRLLQGQSVPCDREDGLYKFYYGGGFYGLVRVTEGFAKAEKKLC